MKEEFERIFRQFVSVEELMNPGTGNEEEQEVKVRFHHIS